MAEALEDQYDHIPVPNLDHLITEDDTPVDSRYSERQMKLLSVPLFESWPQGKPFEALTNVGLFSKPDNESVVVPDFLLSLGVEPKPLSENRESRSYFIWVYGKPPNLVVEIVSNKVGGELDRKLEVYERMGVAFYAVHDPEHYLGNRELRLFRLEGGRYVEAANPYALPELGLGFAIWEGAYLDLKERWLRFTDETGRLIPTGEEKAKEAEERVARAEARTKEAEEELAALKARLQELEEKGP